MAPAKAINNPSGTVGNSAQRKKKKKPSAQPGSLEINFPKGNPIIKLADSQST